MSESIWALLNNNGNLINAYKLKKKKKRGQLYWRGNMLYSLDEKN